MQVTRVLKFIVSCSQAAKIYTMNTLARQAHSQGASWGGKLAQQLKWKLSPDDSAQVDTFIWMICLHCVLSGRIRVCVSVRVCVAVFECLSWHENSQARPCRMCDSAHIDTQLHTHISLSMAVVNMTVIRTTQMLRMFAVLAKTCLAGATGALPEHTFIKLEPVTLEAKAKFPSILFVV